MILITSLLTASSTIGKIYLCKEHEQMVCFCILITNNNGNFVVVVDLTALVFVFLQTLLVMFGLEIRSI